MGAVSAYDGIFSLRSLLQQFIQFLGAAVGGDDIFRHGDAKLHQFVPQFRRLGHIQVVAVQPLQQKNVHMPLVQTQVDQLDSQVHFVA